MKWISVEDRLPNRDEYVIGFVNKIIMIGYFSAIESYIVGPNKEIKDYEKKISFSPLVVLDKNKCDECDSSDKKCGDQCVDCCEKNDEIGLLIPSFSLSQITHWMPLPEPPKKEEAE